MQYNNHNTTVNALAHEFKTGESHERIEITEQVERILSKKERDSFFEIINEE